MARPISWTAWISRVPLPWAQLHDSFVLPFLSRSTPNWGRGRSINNSLPGRLDPSGPGVSGQRAAQGQEEEEEKEEADPYLAVALRPNPRSL